MVTRHSSRPGRAAPRNAFTLIELLVVVGIIALLVALLAGGVMKAFARAHEVQDRNNVQQLANALGSFKAKFGRYPPSRVHLCRLVTQYSASQVDQDSVAFLRSMFPRCDARWATAGINWSADPAWAGDSFLEGEQCLVFFLGGIEVVNNGQPGCVGFSTNPADPGDLSATTRIGPFYQFDSAHLMAAGNFSMYNGPYDAPYAYFSSYNVRNGYGRYQATLGSDCMGLGLSPYQDSAGPPATYWNPETFQIISAGANGKFGPGGLWTPATAGAVGPAGFDDVSNFYDQVLGHASGG